MVDNITIVKPAQTTSEGFFYINGRMKHNMAWYAQYNTFYTLSEISQNVTTLSTITCDY